MKKRMKTGGFHDLDHAIRAAKQAGCACMAGVKPFDVRTKMAAISSYELHFCCPLAR
jgi:hypothetical protein